MKPGLARDDGLRRVSSLTRWMTAGAVVVGGVFTAAVARAVPGHAKSTSAVTTTPDSSGDDPFTTGRDERPATPLSPATPVTPSTTTPASRVVPGTQSPSVGSAQGTLTPPRSRIAGGRGRGSVSSGSS